MNVIPSFSAFQPITDTSANNNDFAKIKLSNETRRSVWNIHSSGHKEIAYNLLRDLGTPEAKHYLALLLLQNNATEESRVVEAIQCLQEANSPRANYTLGIIYLRGLYGVERNDHLALHHLDLASKDGDNQANVVLGYIYWKGGVGNIAASESIATRYLNPENIVNYWDSQASPEFVQEIRQFALEHFDLNNVYNSYLWQKPYGELSEEVRERYAEMCVTFAGKLIEKEVGASGLIWKIKSIWNHLSELYSGKKLPEKFTHAVTQLGKSYFVEKDYRKLSTDDQKKAVKYFTQAAEGGSIEAKYYLGIIYCTGDKSRKRDLVKGKAYLAEAAELGFLPAQTMLNHLNKKQSKKANDRVILEQIKSEKAKMPGFQHTNKEIFKDNLELEKDCIGRNKGFLGKTWRWLKNSDNLGNLLTGILGGALIVGAVVGAVFLAIAQPHVFLGILVVAGVVVVMGGALIAGFAAGGH